MDIFLRKGQGLAGGDIDLQLHQVKPGHQLGHRMLYLQARIHLQEVKILLPIHQELNGAGIGIARRLRHPHRGLTHAAAQFRFDYGGRGLF